MGKTSCDWCTKPIKKGTEATAFLCAKPEGMAIKLKLHKQCFEDYVMPIVEQKINKEADQ
jgi:hypothetical protein